MQSQSEALQKLQGGYAGLRASEIDVARDKQADLHLAAALGG